MALDDWSPAFQDLWDHTPGTSDLDPDQERYAEALFEAGFTHTGDEYDREGLTPDDVHAIRAEFFEFMGIPEDRFDWADWKEAMGYDD